MSTVATAPTSPSAVHEKFSRGPGFVGTLIFIGVLVVGIAYIGWSLSRDLVNLHLTSVLPYFLFGLPVSTTHVLSSGVAGTMAANHSGLQGGTVRNLLMAWVLTLPVAMTLSGFLFWTFRKLF
jgi:PiT family inorganic phosphate transporter